MDEKAADGLLRYEAMTGRLQGLDEAAEANAARDRARYGAAYLPRDAHGSVIWNDLMMIRFLVEVCGLSFRESREAVIENSRALGVRMPDEVPPAPEKARALLAETGDIFAARELAAFFRDRFADAPKTAAYWRGVITALETTRFDLEIVATRDRMRQTKGSGAP